MLVEKIIAADDPRLVDYLGMRDPQGRRVTELQLGCFITEGFTAIERLLASDHRVRSIAALAPRLPRIAELVGDREITVYEVDRDVLATVAGFDLHRGVVASADRPDEPDLDAILRSARTLLVLEGLNDPENLGAIARTSRAFGVDGLVLDPTCADPWARRTVRVSMGQILSLPIVRSTAWAVDIARIQHAGFCLAALTPAGDALSLHRWEVPDRVAFVLGAEGPGLSTETLRAASVRVRIPIASDVDSLNVGHAAAVVLAAVSAGRIA